MLEAPERVWAILISPVYAATVCLVLVLIRMIRPRQTALNYRTDIPVDWGGFSLTVIPVTPCCCLDIPRLRIDSHYNGIGFAFRLIDDTSAAARPKGF